MKARAVKTFIQDPLRKKGIRCSPGALTSNTVKIQLSPYTFKHVKTHIGENVCVKVPSNCLYLTTHVGNLIAINHVPIGDLNSSVTFFKSWQHLKSQTKETLHKCEKCGKAFVSYPQGTNVNSPIEKVFMHFLYFVCKKIPGNKYSKAKCLYVCMS